MYVYLPNTAGMNSRTRKLDDTQVRKIREQFLAGKDKDEIANEFEISRVHLNSIIRRAAWESLE